MGVDTAGAVAVFTAEDSPAVASTGAAASMVAVSPEVTPAPSDMAVVRAASQDPAAPMACAPVRPLWAAHPAPGPQKDKAFATPLPAGTVLKDPPELGEKKLEEKEEKEEKDWVAHPGLLVA
jgi:hypothetical protein